MQIKLSLRKSTCFFVVFAVASVTGSVNAKVIPYQGSKQDVIDKKSASQTKSDTSKSNTIISKKENQILAPFDIAQTSITIKNDTLTFKQQLYGEAGSKKPASIGRLPGSSVAGYVWPTSLNSASVGFDADQGILALAITAHPDFDDTPLYDENNDGNKNNDGNEWHTHWVVLVNDDACGKGGLKVKDIDAGSKPVLPETVPGLPILLDSPGYQVKVSQNSLEAIVPIEQRSFSFDGVTSNLMVNEEGNNPLLCVSKVHDIASGDLSLPGRIQ